MRYTFQDPGEILRSTRLVERFLDYVRIDTQSDEGASSCPSTEKQLDLARRLVEDLKAVGISKVEIDSNGYVFGELQGNAPGAIGLIAHMDTAPAFSGLCVKPRKHENYQGGPIHLEGDVVIDPSDSPELLECKGDTIITSDGTTLLGADDKAGIAEIVSAVEYLSGHPEIPHPTIRICFNPDEEIGRGAHKFPLERFDCPIAYTLDGGFQGEVNVETFSADKALVTFEGVAVHPGMAKGKMVNALTYLGKFLARLPLAESPECTENREGFFHPTDASGDASRCRVQVILRDFDSEALCKRGERLRTIAGALEAEEPRLRVGVEIAEQYRNMHDALAKHPKIRETLRAAVEACGIVPRFEAIRGGTDGSQLTAKGMPTPNIFAGGVEFHGPREWVSTRVMALTVCTVLHLVQLHAA